MEGERAEDGLLPDSPGWEFWVILAVVMAGMVAGGTLLMLALG